MAALGLHVGNDVRHWGLVNCALLSLQRVGRVRACQTAASRVTGDKFLYFACRDRESLNSPQNALARLVISERERERSAALAHSNYACKHLCAPGSGKWAYKDKSWCGGKSFKQITRSLAPLCGDNWEIRNVSLVARRYLPKILLWRAQRRVVKNRHSAASSVVCIFHVLLGEM